MCVCLVGLYIYSSLVRRSDLDFEQRIRAAFRCIQYVILHFREEKSCQLSAVVHFQVLFKLTCIVQDRDQTVRVSLCEIEPSDV